MNLKGKNVFLTGAAGGLGKSLLKKLIGAEANLVITDISRPRLNEALDDLAIDESHPQILDIVAIDLSNESEINEYFDKKSYDIDVVINNAFCMSFGAFINIPCEKWKTDIIVGLFAPMHIIQRLLPRMIENKSGYIVNINSLASTSVQKYKTSYAISKVGLKMFADILKQELEGSNIKMTNIYPYFINTPVLDNVPAYGLDNKTLIDKSLADDPDEIATQTIDAIIKEVYDVYVGSAERCMRYSRFNKH